MKTKKEFKEFGKEVTKLRQEFAVQLQAKFEIGRAALFEAFPKLKSFQWNQCAPAYSDGDPCSFSANTEDVVINDVADSDDEDEDDEVSFPELSKKEEQELREVVSNFLGVFGDAFFEETFGPASEVTVTKDKIVISDYYE